jgi:hypothetical protein
MAASIRAKTARVTADKAEPRRIIADTPERSSHFLSLIPPFSSPSFFVYLIITLLNASIIGLYSFSGS